MQPNVAVESKH